MSENYCRKTLVYSSNRVSRDSSNLSATCFRHKKSCELVADPHELGESQVEHQVCDLDSVMVFGLYKGLLFTAHPALFIIP